MRITLGFLILFGVENLASPARFLSCYEHLLVVVQWSGGTVCQTFELPATTVPALPTSPHFLDRDFPSFRWTPPTVFMDLHFAFNLLMKPKPTFNISENTTKL